MNTHTTDAAEFVVVDADRDDNDNDGDDDADDDDDNDKNIVVDVDVKMANISQWQKQLTLLDEKDIPIKTDQNVMGRRNKQQNIVNTWNTNTR